MALREKPQLPLPATGTAVGAKAQLSTAPSGLGGNAMPWGNGAEAHELPSTQSRQETSSWEEETPEDEDRCL